MDDFDDTRLQALYRSVSRETPSASVDSAILGAAAAKVRRDRATPFLAIAAALVAAVLIARDFGGSAGTPVPGAAPEATRDFLLTMHTPPADASDPAVVEQ